MIRSHGTKITHAGEQIAQWDFQNNATRTSPPGPAFVLEVSLRNLLTSMNMCDFVPCDRIARRAYNNPRPYFIMRFKFRFHFFFNVKLRKGEQVVSTYRSLL